MDSLSSFMKLPTKLKDLAISITFFLVFWFVLSIIVNNTLFPNPIEVIGKLFKLIVKGEVLVHSFASIKRALIGFLFALTIGSGFAYLVSMSLKLRRYIKPLIELIRPIPPLAWIPLAIIWFGIGDPSSIFIIFIAAFFPIFTSVSFGINSIPKIHRKVSKSVNLSKTQEFWHITFPFTLPYLFSGAKTSIGLSWMALIAAEIISARVGLGYLIEINRVLLHTDTVISSMIVIGIIGYLMHQIIIITEKKIIIWRDVKDGL